MTEQQYSHCVASRRLLQGALQALLVVWVLPLTLLGLLVAVGAWFFDRKQHFSHINTAQGAPVFIVHGRAVAWLLHHHPWGSMHAVAIGCCVICCDAPTLDDCLAHELVHVHQALRWGSFFPLAYLLAGAFAWCRGGCAYQDNFFEIAARRADRANLAA